MRRDSPGGRRAGCRSSRRQLGARRPTASSSSTAVSGRRRPAAPARPGAGPSCVVGDAEVVELAGGHQHPALERARPPVVGLDGGLERAADLVEVAAHRAQPGVQLPAEPWISRACVGQRLVVQPWATVRSRAISVVGVASTTLRAAAYSSRSGSASSAAGEERLGRARTAPRTPGSPAALASRPWRPGRRRGCAPGGRAGAGGRVLVGVVGAGGVEEGVERHLRVDDHVRPPARGRRGRGAGAPSSRRGPARRSRSGRRARRARRSGAGGARPTGRAPAACAARSTSGWVSRRSRSVEWRTSVTCWCSWACQAARSWARSLSWSCSRSSPSWTTAWSATRCCSAAIAVSSPGRLRAHSTPITAPRASPTARTAARVSTRGKVSMDPAWTDPPTAADVRLALGLVQQHPRWRRSIWAVSARGSPGRRDRRAGQRRWLARAARRLGLRPEPGQGDARGATPWSWATASTVSSRPRPSEVRQRLHAWRRAGRPCRCRRPLQVLAGEEPAAECAG